MTDRDIPGVVAPPPLLYAAALGAGLLIEHWFPRPVLPQGWAHPLGALLFASGLLGIAAVVAFRRAHTSPNPWKTTTQLVTGGIYRVSRNPMYVGFTLWYLGVASWANSLWPLLLLPLVVVIMIYGVILREERYLDRRFGEEYRRYRAQVRRWL